MRPGKLYFRILLSFQTVLFITILVIFALVHALPGRHLTARLEDFAETKALVIQEGVEDRIRSAPSVNLSKNEPLKKFILDLSKILGAEIWIQNPDHSLALKSFSGEIPRILYRLKKNRARTYGPLTIYRQRGFDFYAIIPVALPRGEKGTIHILFESPERQFYHPDHPEGIFALGLFFIGLMAALLFVPISRIITNRLNQLRQSALTISEGNLSHRADIPGQDEISELAQAFNQMAEKLGSMILNAKELTANVSHELRTPLTRIRISEEILRDKLEFGDVSLFERYLDEIREDIQELDQLIGRILEWSKLDMQASPLVLAPLNPAEILEELVGRLKPIIEYKQLEILSDFSFLPPFSADKEALSTALSALLDNAVKFSPDKGQIHIRINSQSDRIEIRIFNTYEKIPEEELAEIFLPFHRAKRVTTGGSGLGLAIAKKIVERHGGSIEAQNVEKGLEIIISLPRKRVD